MRVLTVICRARSSSASLTAEGFAPYEGCPLCVTHVAEFHNDRGWVTGKEWHIVHIPTGYQLGAKRWKTRDEAMAVLERCEPAFEGWALASADHLSPANKACAYKFKVACQ